MYSAEDVASQVFSFDHVVVLLVALGDAGNTSLVDAGTPLGATAVVTPREC